MFMICLGMTWVSFPLLKCSFVVTLPVPLIQEILPGDNQRRVCQ